jgi:hypothetical protein
MHRREDFPTIDQKQHYRILSGGLDHTWAKPFVDQNPKSPIRERIVL